LLIAQLSNQNPLEPLEDNQLLQQISSINSLSSTSQLIDTLGAFALNQGLGAASNLIGREITAKVGNGSVSGVVQRALVEEGKVFVLVGDQRIPFESITSVGDSANEASALASLDELLSAAEDETIV
jgi:flagellar basal-body rod modification protein FlgD